MTRGVRVSSLKAYRTVNCPRTPAVVRAGGRCRCACVGRGSVLPAAPGPGGEAEAPAEPPAETLVGPPEPDSEPAGGVAGLDTPPQGRPTCCGPPHDCSGGATLGWTYHPRRRGMAVEGAPGRA